MRIIHDIDSEVETSSFTDISPYRELDQKSTGFHIELLGEINGNVEDSINVHGDAYHIRNMLVEWISVLDMHAKSYIGKGELAEDWVEQMDAECASEAEDP